ncbi:unnamed protein product, partial [Schistosoma curassoni]|uniref:Secreted protein n=1 Tax=Schistosoma curassoni TaxID=6186 RepID=A0A183KM52_9TREM
AGDDPDTPTAALNKDSGIASNTGKIDEHKAEIKLISSSVTEDVCAYTAVPTPTRHGVLGIIRIIRVDFGTACCIWSSVIPAAIETKSLSFKRSDRLFRAGSNMCGLTQANTTSLFSTIGSFVCIYSTPYFYSKKMRQFNSISKLLSTKISFAIMTKVINCLLNTLGWQKSVRNATANS